MNVLERPSKHISRLTRSYRMPSNLKCLKSSTLATTEVDQLFYEQDSPMKVAARSRTKLTRTADKV